MHGRKTKEEAGGGGGGGGISVLHQVNDVM